MDIRGPGAPPGLCARPVWRRHAFLQIDPAYLREGLPRFPLPRGPESLVVGRGRDCDLVLSSPFVGRRQAQIGFEGGAWFVRDLQSPNGIFLGQQRILGRAWLSDGDPLRFSDVPARFVEQRSQGLRCPALEAAIGEAPGEDARWRVYADWLLACAQPLGPGHDAWDPHALGARLGSLRVTWRHGLIEAIELPRGPASELGTLSALLELPVAGPLRSLTCRVDDPQACADGPAGASLIETLRRAGPWPALREVSFCDRADPSRRCALAGPWAQRSSIGPRLGA